MKRLFKRSSLAGVCMHANYMLLVTLFDKINVPLYWASDIYAHVLFFCRLVFKTTQVALLFSDFLVGIVQ